MVGEEGTGDAETVGVEVGAVEPEGLEKGKKGRVEGAGEDGIEPVGDVLGPRKGKSVAGLRYPRNIRITISEAPAAAAANIQRVNDHSDKL